jgi:hypothetical protein
MTDVMITVELAGILSLLDVIDHKEPRNFDAALRTENAARLAQTEYNNRAKSLDTTKKNVVE